MDFLDPNKKRAHTIKLYIGYALMAIAIGLGAVILLYVAYGYGVDRQGNVFQNGLVFLASTPDAAEVKITSEDKSRTQTAITSERLILPAGRYDFEFLKQGYKPWQRTVELRGGGVQRLVYPFLFPENLQREDVATYATVPPMATVTPDRSTILVQRPDTLAEFEVFDANNPEQAKTAFTVPSNLFTQGQKHGLELVEWSTNNRHFLVKHSYTGGTEYLMIDRENPAASTNLNTVFRLNPKTVVMRDKNPDQLYIHQNNNELLSADVSERRTSSVVKNALAFQPHGNDTLLYMAPSDNTTASTVGVYILTDNEAYKIRELPKSSRYLLDLAQFNGNWLVAAGAATDNRVYVYRNPVTALRANPDAPQFSIRTMRIENPQHISFSANTQFIAVQAGQTFNVYDALDDRQYHYTIDTSFDKGSGKAVWMDGHRLLTTTAGKITVFDFDGSNYQMLTAITVGTIPMLDRDYTSLYAIAPSTQNPKRTGLVQTPLRAETD